MTCCGKERKTAFCPDCGRKIDPRADLWGLLAACRASESRLRKMAKGYRRTVETLADDAAYRDQFSRRADTNEANADRWKAWGDALEALLHPEGREG